jgi:O-antigen/teichoic acid export membrane protein
MAIVYFVAIIIAYLLPAYTSNPYIIRGLPLGMIFSASFMAAWILQLPLQLFWKMKDLSIWLVLARISQIIILILTLFVLVPNVDFWSWEPKSVIAFCLILLSVVASGITQLLFVLHKSNQKLKLKVQFDKKFTKDILKSNWKYGVSYYLSSFHTLIVLIFLSNFFPTSQWFVYTGIWGLGLTLVEVFLIIPSALWNSLLHNIAAYSKIEKQKSFGNLMTLVTRIWSVIILNMLVFNNEIIYTISWADYIWASFLNPGTNTILPFLAIVLFFSFIKQIFNYIFVANNKQNKLLGINLFGVTIGLSAWLYLIPNFQIAGWIITQVWLELLFVSWAIYVAAKYKLLPKINRKKMLTLLGISIIIWWTWFYVLNFILHINYTNFWHFLIAWFAINIPILLLSLPTIKKVAKWLTKQD